MGASWEIGNVVVGWVPNNGRTYESEETGRRRPFKTRLVFMSGVVLGKGTTPRTLAAADGNGNTETWYVVANLPCKLQPATRHWLVDATKLTDFSWRDLTWGNTGDKATADHFRALTTDWHGAEAAIAAVMRPPPPPPPPSPARSTASFDDTDSEDGY